MIYITNMQKPYQHLFFDIDRTLWDFESNSVVVMRQLFDKYNLETLCQADFDTYYAFYKTTNQQLWDLYSQGRIVKEFLHNQRFYYTLLHFKVDDMALSIRMANDLVDLIPLQTRLFPEVEDTLSYLQNRGYHLHIISNGFPEIQYNKLKNAEIFHFFKKIIISEEQGFTKPDIRIFKRALQLAGAFLQDSLMIGDDYNADIVGAQNAGLDQVFVDTHNTSKPATFVIKQIAEIKEIL